MFITVIAHCHRTMASNDEIIVAIAIAIPSFLAAALSFCAAYRAFSRLALLEISPTLGFHRTDEEPCLSSGPLPLRARDTSDVETESAVTLRQFGCTLTHTARTRPFSSTCRRVTSRALIYLIEIILVSAVRPTSFFMFSLSQSL
jgi:hypothetical protein